ncbi:MAG: type I-E CRISPR-associated protein Cas7/Cse4/CasC [Lachnospiraceae bacterium]|nr:type I-E CRISPR-associated protein Cas7/Cse4/CasC [Lachnospiraceae bacterium]MCI9282044.1 type I-E CRISPR-associated protein Cas7/Cse4/CasC [Lachnospiraceae bacterium]
MDKNLYMDIHIIQTVPPSCVNRDDTGSPKMAMYGGTMRARVSSQAWKRAMRQMFKELFSADFIGYRTKRLPELIAAKMYEGHEELDSEAVGKTVNDVLALAGVKAGGDKKSTLFFASSQQIKNIAELAVKYHKDTFSKESKKKIFKADLEKAVNDNPSVDILLFGRMAASNVSLNYDAAAQVAHSISTHTVSNEYDYFTAVDDCGEKDTAGAGHLGTVEFNSSTLYRYATVNIRELADNLEVNELKMAVRGFTEAFIRSMPTGRQNTFANRTLPSLVYVAMREDQPINLAGAFERPVVARDKGYVEESKRILAEYAGKVYADYVAAPSKAWAVGGTCGDLAEQVNLAELLEMIEQETGRYLGEGK